LTVFDRQFAEAAGMLGAAARLRGTHDRTDPQVRLLAGQIRAALGEIGFTEAYEKGWLLDGKAASAEVDPARLRRAALPGPDSAAPPELGGPPVQARRA